MRERFAAPRFALVEEKKDNIDDAARAMRLHDPQFVLSSQERASTLVSNIPA